MSDMAEVRPAAVAAERAFLETVGVNRDFAAHVAALDGPALAHEITSARDFPDAGANDVLADLADRGPRIDGRDPRDPSSAEMYAEHFAFVHRLAGHLGLEVTVRQEGA